MVSKDAERVCEVEAVARSEAGREERHPKRMRNEEKGMLVSRCPDMSAPQATVADLRAWDSIVERKQA